MTAASPAAARAATPDDAAAGGAVPPAAVRPFLRTRLRREQPRVPWHRNLAAALAGALTIAVLGLGGDVLGRPLLIAAFGSSCVLVFLLPGTPLARPLNVVGGHVVAAACGLLVAAVAPVTWWSLGAAVGLGMAAMAALRVIHPPAGGTPVAVMLAGVGWDYLVTPVLAGALTLTASALAYQALLHAAERRRAR